jgi:arylsulfatase A-like enzyme
MREVVRSCSKLQSLAVTRPFGQLHVRTAAFTPWLAVLALVLTACSRPDPTLVVIARLGDPHLEVAPPQTPRAIYLGNVSRPGVCGGAEDVFEVAVPDAASGLRFSVGLDRDSRTRDAGGLVRFVVKYRGQGGDAEWRQLHDNTVSSGDDWSSHVVDLDSIAQSETRLRFETERPAAAPSPGELHTRAACWGSVLFEGRAGASGAAPSVVLISLDTLGAAHLSCFEGFERVSPNMDTFLADSFSFRRAYAQFGNTLVSHSSLFSGLYPVRHKRYSDAPGRGGSPRMPSLRSLVGHLAASGYATVAFTENAFVGSAMGFGVGFDLYDNGPVGELFGEGARVTFENALTWLESFGPDRRFFLFLHTYEVHNPYRLRDAAATEFARQIGPVDGRSWNGLAFLRNVRAHNAGSRLMSKRTLARLRVLYNGEIHYLDRVVGDLLERLKALLPARETLIVLTSDHGELFGEGGQVGHGTSLHNRVMHVPLAFHWPGRIRTGEATTPVQLVDVFPTVLELVGIPIPEELDGRSLAAHLLGTTEHLAPRPAFAEHRQWLKDCDEDERAAPCLIEGYFVQTERFKLVRHRDGRSERFYDLDQDPLESRDVAAAHPKALAEHRELLTAYIDGAREETTDREDVELEIDADTRARLKVLGYIE